MHCCIGFALLTAFTSALAQPLSFASDPARMAKITLGEERGSVAVGVWQQGRAAYAFQSGGPLDSSASASAALESIEHQKLYEIGSISKVFTGLLLAQAVEKGDLSLDDALGKLLDGKIAFQSPQVAAITLRQLVTHSSCLPRLPKEIAERSGGPNPYAAFHRRMMWQSLTALSLSNSPPCAPAYSNFGLGLVGEILSERYGKPWQTLVHDNITAPLGMMDTVQDLGSKADRMAAGFNNAESMAPWDFQAMAGAGALRSTAADMLIFSRAMMAGPDGPLGEAAVRMRTPLGVFGSGQIGYAMMIRGPVERRIYHHDGLTGGYRAQWMIAPDTQEAAVALAGNTHAAPGRLLAALTAHRYPIAESVLASVGGTATAITSDQLNEFAGVYRIDKLSGAVVVAQDSVLYARFQGGGRYRSLAYAGKDLFIDTEFAATLQFLRIGGRLTGLTYSQGGGGFNAERIGNAPPTIAVLPNAAVQDYVGRYFLERPMRRNLDFDVKAEAGQLAVRSGNWPRQAVSPMANQPDRFVYANVKAELQFERDANSKVIALVLHEGAAIRIPRFVISDKN